jgi:hypothetical protein
VAGSRRVERHVELAERFPFTQRPSWGALPWRRAMPFQVALVRALAAMMPTCLLLAGSAVLFSRAKTVGSFLQLLGAGCLVVVVLTHIFEALHLFPWMQWGLEHSAGHYLDLGSAVLGVTSFPVGYLVHALRDD